MKTLVIMPFAETFSDVYRAIGQAASKCREFAAADVANPRREQLQKLTIERVDEGHGAASIMSDLLHRIEQSQLCIADISTNNPNVLWELGYATALKKPTIILTHTIEDAPFDVSAYRALVYDRNRLNDTLIGPLAREIAGVLREVPERFVSPDDVGHAQTLALSTGSPAYFLDVDFTIRYMNEAAIAMFFAETNDAPSAWVGRSLGDFIISIRDRLMNLAAIEKNLAVQKEHLERNNNAGSARPFDTERVVLDTIAYGIVELQKTGVAVRDSSDGRITGWVVSFNVVEPKEPQKFAAFHSRHRAILQRQIFAYTAKVSTQNEAPAAKKSATDEWRDEFLAEASLTWASEYEQKQQAFAYMSSIMIGDGDRYGLDSVNSLEEWFFDFRRTEYLVLATPNGKTVGLLRLHIDHDVTQYVNLNEELREWHGDGQRFADVGAYFHPKMPPAMRCRLLARMLGKGVSLCESQGVTNLYAQVRMDRIKKFREFGFSEAGEPFPCRGWKGKWIPIYVKNWSFVAPDGLQTSDGQQFRHDFQAARQESELLAPAI